MKHTTPTLALGLILALSPLTALAHCDTMDGPVVTAARVALANRNVTPVLKWVKPADEAAVRAAFDRTLAVRQASAPARDLADTWFFETLVRLHRAGEGAPYSGLSTEPTEPGIAAADAALKSGETTALVAATTARLQTQLLAKLEHVRALQPDAEHSVAAGREYVEAYVDYVHFAEKLGAMAGGEPHTH